MLEFETEAEGGVEVIENAKASRNDFHADTVARNDRDVMRHTDLFGSCWLYRDLGEMAMVAG